MGYRVKGTPVAVSLGPEGGSQVVQFIDAGGTLPRDIADVQVKHLLMTGLIEAVNGDPEPDLDPVVGADVEPAAPAPEALTVESMTVEQLKAHLTGQGIPFDGVALKADLLALAQQ